MARESSMADRREYVRVSVSLPMNPKLGMIDDPAVSWLYVVSLCHCGEYLTDGMLIPSIVARAAGVEKDLGKRLVSAGLWHEPGHDCPRCAQPADGYMVVHDFLMHQRSRAQAEQVRTVRKAAANSRWSKRDASSMQVASGVQCNEDAAGTQAASGMHPNEHHQPPPDATSMQVASPVQCKPDAEEEGEGEQTPTSSVGGSGGDASQQAAPPTKRGTRISRDWWPSQQKRQSLTARFDRPDQWWHDETQKFVNWFLQKAGRDATSLDWDARFDVWIREAISREGKRVVASGSHNGRPTKDEEIRGALAKAKEMRTAQDHEPERQPELGM